MYKRREISCLETQESTHEKYVHQNAELDLLLVVQYVRDVDCTVILKLRNCGALKFAMSRWSDSH